MKVTLRSLAGVLACASAVAAVPALAAPSYSITALDGTNCAPYGINDMSVVTGACGNAAVMWRNGKRITLGTLPKGMYAVATAANAQGVVVGDGDDGDGRPLGWISTTKGLTNFFSNNGGNTRPIFIGDSGFIGGSYVKFTTNAWRAAIWMPDAKDARKSKLIELPLPAGAIDPASTASMAAGFNQSGAATGNITNDVIGQHAAFWAGDAAHTLVDLGTLPGDWSSLGWGINDLGQVVGESHPPGGSRPALWNNDPAHTPIALDLFPGDNYGAANAINNLGQVIGWTEYYVPGEPVPVPSRPVLWLAGVPHDANTLLDPATSAGWSIIDLIAINNVGEITGLAWRDGVMLPFIMKPQ